MRCSPNQVTRSVCAKVIGTAQAIDLLGGPAAEDPKIPNIRLVNACRTRSPASCFRRAGNWNETWAPDMIDAKKRSSLLVLMMCAGRSTNASSHREKRARSTVTPGLLVLWNYWGTTRIASVPCSKPVTRSLAGTVPMGPLAARHAGFGTGHGNGGRPPYSKTRLWAGCVDGSCVILSRLELTYLEGRRHLVVGRQTGRGRRR